MKAGTATANSSLVDAIHLGDLDQVRNFVDLYGLCFKDRLFGHCLLKESIDNGHTEIAELLLSCGAEVDCHNPKYCDTPLHVAAYNGYTNIVEQLLSKGASTIVKNQSGDTPLHSAVQGQKSETVRLLSAHTNVNVCNARNETPLHVAAKSGNLGIVVDLLNHSAVVNSDGQKVPTPLHLAAEQGHKQVVMLLVSKGANINSKFGSQSAISAACKKAFKSVVKLVSRPSDQACHDRDGQTVLHFAVVVPGNEEVVKFLLASGADINAKSSDGLTPLHIAVKAGQKKIAELLLENGANVNASDKEGKTALFFAAQSKHFALVHMIFKFEPDLKNKDIEGILNSFSDNDAESIRVLKTFILYRFETNQNDQDNIEILHTFIESGSIELVEEMCKRCSDVSKFIHSFSKDGFTALHTAVRNSRDDIVKLLKSFGAEGNPDKTGKTPAFYSIENGWENITKILLSVGDKEHFQLCHAVRKGCIDNVQSVLENGVDVNFKDELDRTPLHLTCYPFEFASHDNMGAIAKLLLDHGADVNAEFDEGNTVLSDAIVKEYEQILVVLLDFVDVNDQNCYSEDGIFTPLQWACINDNPIISTLILKKGADINAKRHDGRTALHLASSNSNKNVAEVLLKWNVEIESKDQNGDSALHSAAEWNAREVCWLLLNHGADINSVNNLDKTPLHLAVKKENVDIVFALLQYWPDINYRCKNNMTALDYVEEKLMDEDLIKSGHSSSGNEKSYLEWAKSKSNNYQEIFECCSEQENSDISKIAEILRHYIVKLNAAKLFVGESNLQSLDFANPCIKRLKADCELELEKMKTKEIDGSDCSLYDFVTKSRNDLPNFENRNPNLSDYKSEFPIYGGMILCNINRV